MSRDGHEGWNSPPRSRDTDSSPRSHRRRGSGQADDRRQPNGRDEAGYEYGSPEVHADQGDYGSRQHGAEDGYGADGYRADGYGRDYRGGADPAASYGNDYQGGYGQEQYAEPGYADQGYDGGGYADGYGAGYADDGYGAAGRDAYAARDPYASRDPYSTGDYGPADPYAGPDPRASGPLTGPDPRASGPLAGPDPRVSGPHGMTDPRGSTDPYRRSHDPYDTGGGGYRGSEGYADAPGYAGQDGFAGQDPYASPAGGGSERGGYEQQDDDLYRWRDPQGAGDDPGATRRRRASREGDLDAEDPRHDGFFRGFGGGDDDLGGRGAGRSQNRGGRPPKKKRKSKAGLVALGIVLAVLAGLAYTGYHYYSAYKAKHASYAGPGYGHVIILVQTGDTLDGISSQLLHKGVIEAIDPWASYVANKSGLHPGKYRIHLHMSPAAAYAALTNQKNLVNSKVTIPDGMREVDILPLLAKESGLPLSQFQTAIKNTAALGLPAYANGNPEGYLYPDTYDIAPGETALKILQTAVVQFNKEATALNLAAAAAHVGYTPAQIITGASLLEAEASSRYFGQVARVIDNRINQGMDLQLDSTIAYALNKHTDQLTASDKQVNSPYNTFTHNDLPPGPIDSPDAAAIQAFLSPPHGDWLYFITVDKSGTTDFTNSYSQFQTWMAQAKQNGV